jgi:hypothetical protein
MGCVIRGLAVAGLAALVLSTAACGGVGTSAAGSLAAEAAGLVPPDAVAFVSVDPRLDSDQWRTVRELFGPVRLPLALDERDVEAALGDELNVAVLGVHEGEPEAVAIVKPADEAKLRTLAAKFDHGDEHYTVEGVGDWAVVADSEGAFDAVRRAEAGRSLADVQQFQRAMEQLDGNSLAVAYAGGGRSQLLSGKLRGLAFVAGLPDTVAARLAAEDDAVRLQVRLNQQREPASAYRPRLLRDVPSGALLAVSFKNPQRLLERLAAEPTLRDATAAIDRALGVSVAALAPALRGEGVLYVTQATLLPTFVLEVASENPDAAARVLRRVAAKSTTLPLQVFQRGDRVFLSNGRPLPTPAGGRLVDDRQFKDALSAADTPEQVTWLAYADLHRLLPVLQVLSQTLGSRRSAPRSERPALDRLGTLIAFGARSGSATTVEIRIARR